MPRATDRKGKMLYAEVPEDVFEALEERCQKSGWTKREEIILALRHWFSKPVQVNPAAAAPKKKGTLKR